MLVVLLQISSPCKLLVRVFDMIVLGELHECFCMLHASTVGMHAFNLCWNCVFRVPVA